MVGRVNFALVVRGDSMIGAGINDGDYAICKQRETALNGQVVVALVNGSETTLKYYIQENEMALLRAAKPEFKDIVLKPGDKVQVHAVKIFKDPPPVNMYRGYIYFKEGHLQEWNGVTEKALSCEVKPSLFQEFIDMQVELPKRLANNQYSE